MSARYSSSWIRLGRNVLGVAAVLAIWETFARSGLFSQALTPPLNAIFSTLWTLVVNGSLFHNAAMTLARVLGGLLLACLIGIPLGILMARFRPWERFWLPLTSVLMPIPSLAWIPLFILWFGIGEITTILVVTYAATFPIIYNVWTGVRSINPIWGRAASSMGAGQRAMFWKVVLPGSLPYLITGVRQSFGRAWIAVIGGELLASPKWGLGRVIFDAKEYLNSDVMMAALLTIGALGLLFERVAFQKIERRTVARWGMLAGGTSQR
jgi:NitT/TauT family transport system permease protein